MCASTRVALTNSIDCKTVRIFAYSSTREQLNKRSGTKVKTESKTGERRYGYVRLARFARVTLLRHALPISLLVLRKKPTVLQSTNSKAEVINDVKCPPSPKAPAQELLPQLKQGDLKLSGKHTIGLLILLTGISSLFLKGKSCSWAC